ncbi:glycosyltransferase [Candidatus Pelagibacter sp.]|nr:glycosyltransferase [Candidatus Pelagibacter sp.]
MKISAVIVSRNDNYGGHLNERATYCLNSAIDTYDEVIYIDWNSPTHSLLYDIKDNIKFKGNFKHFVITPEIASLLTNNDPNAQKCCEVLARNIGLRRATGDYLVSTNIDIIHPKRNELENIINNMSKDTFYTISRRHTDWAQIKEFHNDEIKFDEWEKLREYLIVNSEERHFDETTVNGDDYSIINCCGDYQIAPKHVWKEIRGMEEDLIYSLYADTNVQKKSVMHGFELKALYNPALFHIEHGKGGGGFLDGINKLVNDPYRAIVNQEKTLNTESWGFGNTDIEFEIF